MKAILVQKLPVMRRRRVIGYIFGFPDRVAPLSEASTDVDVHIENG